MWTWGYILLWPISLDSSLPASTIILCVPHPFCCTIPFHDNMSETKANLSSLYIDHLRHPSTVKITPTNTLDEEFRTWRSERI